MTILEHFARKARARDITFPQRTPKRAPSLTAALTARRGLIAELKPRSPTPGELRDIVDGGDPPLPEKRELLTLGADLASDLVRMGAAGFSALTEPTLFGGSLELIEAAVATGAPVLMKDFVVTDRQLQFAERVGASAVLLILPLLSSTHSDWPSPREAIDAVHRHGLEVLLEVYDEDEYLIARRLRPDMVGVNNRPLNRDGLDVNLTRANHLFERHGPMAVPQLALSGFRSGYDVRAAIRAGARGVLVGSALMEVVRAKGDLAAKLRELMEGLDTLTQPEPHPHT